MSRARLILALANLALLASLAAKLNPKGTFSDGD
jgi:hypothetical protein